MACFGCRKPIECPRPNCCGSCPDRENCPYEHPCETCVAKEQENSDE